MAMFPFYKIKIDDNTEGMDFIAFVDNPAHMKAFEFFGNNNKPIKQYFNDEKRIVTGVAVSVDQPIYRNSEDIGEHYVLFDKDETFKIAQKMMQSMYLHNVNEMHNSNRVLKDVYLIESYFIDRKRGVNEPESFKGQNLKDGSWIVSYYVKNDKVWNDIKQGKHIGFSIEGWFDKAPINISKTKQNKQMKKGKSSLRLFIDSFKKQEKFGSAMTVDGAQVVWDGEELVEGIELRVATDEGEKLAPEGEHAVVINEVPVIVTVDGNGIITSVAEAQEEEEMSSEETEENIDEIVAEFNSQLDKRIDEKINKEVEAKDKEIEELKNEIKELKDGFSKLVDALDKEEKPKYNKTAQVKKKSASFKELV